MKKFRILILAALILGAVPAVRAAKAGVKADMDGRAGRIALGAFAAGPGLKLRHAEWLPTASRQNYLIAQSPANLTSEWRGFSFKFTPESSGVIDFNLRGAVVPTRETLSWVVYRKLEVAGGEFVGGAPAGELYGAHSRYAARPLTVAAGREVTVSFEAKAGPETAPDAVIPGLELPGKPAPAAPAASCRVKVDVDGRLGAVKFPAFAAGAGLQSYHADWLPEKSRSIYLINRGRAALTPEWQRFSFKFTPDAGGRVALNFRGVYAGDKKKLIWAVYRKVEVTGGEFIGDAPAGEIYGSHSRYTERPLKVTAGREVTVSFEAKAGPETAADAAVPGLAAKADPAARRAADNMPKEYYDYYGPTVKLLPLADKGLPGSAIPIQAPDTRPGRPLPLPPFDSSGLEQHGKLDYAKIPVEVLNETPAARDAALRFGFPLPAGGLFSTARLRLLDGDGQEIPAQYTATGYWPDRSLKWVLVQTRLTFAGGEKKLLQMEAGEKVRRGAFASPLKVTREGDIFRVDTGKLTAEVSGKAFRFLEQITVDGKAAGEFDPAGLVLENEAGEAISGAAQPAAVTVEEAGPEAVTLKAAGRLDKFGYTARLRFYRDSAAVRVEITCLNDNLETEFTDFTALRLDFNPAAKIAGLGYQLEDGGGNELGGAGSLFQADECTLNGQPGAWSGSTVLATAAGNFGVGLRDAAKRYPKGLTVTPERLRIALLPPLPSPEFGRELPHYLRFPFVSGKYRLKWGIAFTEKLFFDFGGRAELGAVEAENNLPALAVIDRDWYFKTQAIPGSSAAGDHSFDDWDRQMDRAVAEHWIAKRRQREFGYLNYGDWYGERGRNWGNNEYDLAHGMFVHFIRTGNRDAARLAQAAAQHQADVDIVKAYPDPYYLGANAPHSIGHTGSSYHVFDRASWTFRYDRAYSAQNGHTWSQGMLNEWQLSGNAGVMSSALMLGEHIVNYMAPHFRELGDHERSGGWSLKAITALYGTVPDPLYLAAADKIAGIALNEQNFEKGGAWPHKLPRGHAGGQPDTFGNCPYLVGILIEGLRQYHRTTGSPAAAKSIVAAAGWLKKSFLPDQLAWPYGASWDGKPYNGAAPNLNLLIAPAVIYAANLSNDAELFDIAAKVMSLGTFKGLNPAGKALSLDLATTPGLIDGLAIWNSRHPDRQYVHSSDLLLRGRTPAFRLRAPELKQFLIRAKTANPEITLVRTRCGSRARAKPEGSLVFRRADGTVLAEKTYPTRDSFTAAFSVKAGKGELITLEISDDMTAEWNLPVAAAYDAFALLGVDSSISNCSMMRYYFTVPAGAAAFTVRVSGIHSGSFGVDIFGPDGKSRGEVRGMNHGSSRLPWLDYSQEADPVQRLEIAVSPAAKAEVWSLLLWGARDVSLSLEGIPSAVSTVPALFPEGR